MSVKDNPGQHKRHFSLHPLHQVSHQPTAMLVKCGSVLSFNPVLALEKVGKRFPRVGRPVPYRTARLRFPRVGWPVPL
ncbi:hypothetical protein GDO81_027736 [Engystomops pustulosus]|uniref:Uncharacterized protein n=1 Tax=Engystomops pustulosus TaxID=76066 RepID=A0AAV6ZK33_ENGPU|nr:hypothetical protein GDO81_027736 [Engystomops pustulosus]